MQLDEIYAVLTEIFRDVFLDEAMELTPMLSAKDVNGWDSYKQIEIILATEARFGIKLRTREIDALFCVGDLANLVAARKAAPLNRNPG